MWGVLSGWILEEAKQTGLQDTTASEHSDNAQMAEKFGVRVKVHLSTENSSPKKQNSAWFPQNPWEKLVSPRDNTDIQAVKKSSLCNDSLGIHPSPLLHHRGFPSPRFESLQALLILFPCLALSHYI